MKIKFLFIAVLIGTLAIPLMDMQIISLAFAQTSDKSFKGNEPPFIPPPDSDRIPKAPPSDAISIKDRPPIGVEDTDEEEDEEIDKDIIPPLTAREIQELPFDTINDPEIRDVKIIPNATSFSDPIKSIVEEIIKNETIVSNDNDLNSFNSSKIKNKFDATQLEQIFIAQNMSRDSETSLEGNDTEIISNTTADHDDSDNILSETNLPNRDILNFINNTKAGSNTTEAEEQPAITDDLSRQGNVTINNQQNNEEEPLQGGKTITIEEIPLQSADSQEEEATEGNVTIKGQEAIIDKTEEPGMTQPSELQEEDQQQQQPLEGATDQTTKNVSKIKVSETCNDDMDNDQDGIIDEEHACISQSSDTAATSEKIIPELATSDDNDKEEVEDEKNIQDEKNSGKEEQVNDDSKNSKYKNNKVIDEEQISLNPESRPGGVEILTTGEICNDEMDNDLDGSIDEKKDCINK